MSAALIRPTVIDRRYSTKLAVEPIMFAGEDRPVDKKAGRHRKRDDRDHDEQRECGSDAAKQPEDSVNINERERDKRAAKQPARCEIRVLA